MDTKIIKVKENITKDQLEEIKSVFDSGGLVVFPTETVYGLGADGLNPEALKKVYQAKNRPGDNPLILHIAEISQLDGIVENISEDAKNMMEMFWPGPLTLIMNRTENVPDEATAGLETVAVRMPSHEVARAILSYCKKPIAAPSANISGKPSTTSFQRVFEDLNGKVEVIVDGGKATVGIESTVVDTTVNPPLILRPGKVTKEDLQVVVPNIGIDESIISKDESIVPKSPGQKYKHYAPKAEAYCFVGNLDNVVKEINKRITEQKNKKIAVLATDETVEGYEGAHFLASLGSRENLEEIASNLFEDLRKCDDEKVDIIYVEGFELRGLGVSIMNRLLKACSGRVVFGL
ncbi:L-threonylcarbamoyladenylate synthase [Peptoniphilus asaccharolyticus DSM 20463]|uniref:Threonylcarbamoyl-AMP synthase n=1 Tax=Peptoniphilus asaccharolyticus DSM 20463 TaxID=573058 RepID=A0A1W1VLE4_PEPAS|nr:L-threonylcarbamoyladenylate synthase [Peptoniphilus asaccharolyticus]MBL7574466.1 threonylcarbamoyl-AMP synthase [Peptoniphilus asaccharolyticus]SMB93861.1 L-threonylcarbamoyladenylate synthase [Peptoniphilus asaccharolyticus DSM 20463]